jgi:hypothetical protein
MALIKRPAVTILALPTCGVRKVRRTQSKAVERSPLTVGVVPVLSLAVIAATLYSILRILLDAIATSRRDQAKLQAEVLVLRRQVQGRQLIKQVLVGLRG